MAAVAETDLSMICVGTPSQLNGSLDLKYVREVCEQIGIALKDKTSYHVVVARSTMLPGSMKQVVIPTLEEYSGKRQERTSASATTRSSCAKAPPSTTSTIRRRQ